MTVNTSGNDGASPFDRIRVSGGDGGRGKRGVGKPHLLILGDFTYLKWMIPFKTQPGYPANIIYTQG
jgi:hypothetical protein